MDKVSYMLKIAMAAPRIGIRGRWTKFPKHSPHRRSGPIPRRIMEPPAPESIRTLNQEIAEQAKKSNIDKLVNAQSIVGV